MFSDSPVFSRGAVFFAVLLCGLTAAGQTPHIRFLEGHQRPIQAVVDRASLVDAFEMNLSWLGRFFEHWPEFLLEQLEGGRVG